MSLSDLLQATSCTSFEKLDGAGAGFRTSTEAFAEVERHFAREALARAGACRGSGPQGWGSVQVDADSAPFFRSPPSGPWPTFQPPVSYICWQPSLKLGV